jgi:hypothetical protein
VYQAVAPQFVNPDKQLTSEWLEDVITKNFEDSGCFGPVTTKPYFWTQIVTGEQYIKDLRTFSMHHGINEALRNKLYAGILAVIDRFGGKVAQPQSVILFHARVKR